MLLKAYNPHEIPPDLVRKVATGRTPALEKIISAVRVNLSAPIKQHLIVSAPRGYGKSFLLRYVEVTITDLAAAEGLPVAMALLPEELPHVKDPETLIAEIRRSFLNAPANTVGVRWSEDDGTAWDEAVNELDASIEQRFGTGRGLLVVGVENFDVLIGKAFAKSVQSARLRALLTRFDGRLMLVAASARGTIDRSYDVPLFQAFDEVALTPWSIEEVVAFLAAQRQASGKPPLTTSQNARAKAVATFISGTPRLATLIGEALLDDDPVQAAALLDRLIDELTPYYKERVDVLPARSQLLLDALLRYGEPCSATELARRVEAPGQSSIAAPLDDLKRDLLILGEKSPDSAEVLLRVVDRVFAHYYRKRILSHGQEVCPLEALVDLLAVAYSPEEKRRQAEKFASLGLMREAAVMERLWREDQKAETTPVGEYQADFDGIFAEWNRVIEERQFDVALALVDRFVSLAREGRYDEREAQALSLRTFTLRLMDRTEECLETAHEAASKAAGIGNTEMQLRALCDAADSLVLLERYEEALVASREVASKAADIYTRAEALRIEAWSLDELGRQEEALAIARNAAAYAKSENITYEQRMTLRLAAYILNELGRHEEAIATARDAVANARKDNDTDAEAVALGIVASSLVELGHNEEAVTIALDAFAKAEISGDPSSLVEVARTVLAVRLRDVTLALKSYQFLIFDAAAIADDHPQAFFDDVAWVVTVGMDWPALVALLNKAPEIVDSINKNTLVAGEPGRAIIAAFSAGEFQAARHQARHFITALAQAIDDNQDVRLVRLWKSVIETSAKEIAAKIEDPKFLIDVAEILAAHSQMPANAMALITAAAAYHTAGRDPAELARLDPDLRTMLITVFPPEASDRSRTGKPRKKNKAKPKQR